jgi:hypothetical protein
LVLSSREVLLFKLEDIEEFMRAIENNLTPLNGSGLTNFLGTYRLVSEGLY